jgi:formiminotetrahydrofolate cyclodeaminase
MSESTKLSCEEFVSLLASAAPAPGGGGAAALVAAIGMALGNMVGSLTVGKQKYADVQEDIISLKKQADDLQQQLIELVAKDAEVFEPLAKAYGLPRQTEAEKLFRLQTMEALLRDCTEVPLQIMRLAARAIDLHEEFASKGAAIAISDVGCGVIICKAALQAASLNVFINTLTMQDKEYAANVNEQTYELVDTYSSKADQIFNQVQAKLQVI